jgi:competence protein ComEA
LNNDQNPYKEFDYSRQDSLFNNAGKNNKSALNASKNVQKRVDYKQELLDFRNDKFSLRKESKPVLKEKSINLNTAGVKELSRLPGIGLITAKKIIELREKKDGFNVLKELLEVKGIGNIKFNNIKSFVFIE